MPRTIPVPAESVVAGMIICKPGTEEPLGRVRRAVEGMDKTLVVHTDNGRVVLRNGSHVRITTPVGPDTRVRMVEKVLGTYQGTTYGPTGSPQYHYDRASAVSHTGNGYVSWITVYRMSRKMLSTEEQEQ